MRCHVLCPFGVKRRHVSPAYDRLWRSRHLGRLPLAKEAMGLGRCDCARRCRAGSCLNSMMMIECTEKNCHLKVCENRQFLRAQQGDLDHQVEIYWTGSDRGYGLRAAREIAKGQLVAEYVGEIVSQSSVQNWRYVMSLPQGYAIDASMAGSPARFINHSCEPNSRAERWLVKGRWRVGIFACRGIYVGEEITFSYSNGRGQNCGEDPCHCGSKLCCGRIGGRRRGEERKAPAALPEECGDGGLLNSSEFKSFEDWEDSLTLQDLLDCKVREKLERLDRIQPHAP